MSKTHSNRTLGTKVRLLILHRKYVPLKMASSKNTIKHFFKTVKSKESIPSEETNENPTEEFYKSCLEEQNCTNSECKKHIVEFQQKLKKSKEELQKVEKAIDVCKRICESKDKKIQHLKQNLSIETKNSANSDSENQQETIPFGDFSPNFTDSQLCELRSFNVDERNDSTFVTYVLRHIYSDDLTKLDGMNVTGRCIKGVQKTMMSPKKRKLVEDLFAERLKIINTSSESKKARQGKIVSRINTAISTIRRTNKGTTTCKNSTLNIRINK